MMSGITNVSIPSTDEDLNVTDLQRTLEAHRPIKIGIISVLGVMITLGNIAVVMVIASAVSGWSRNSRYFLLSLTGADSAFGLLIMPLNLCVSFTKEYNEGPDPFCHVVAFFNATIYSTCMYTLATISLERYIAVFYPLKYSTVLTRRRALLLISFAWIFPPLLLVPISFPAGIIEVHFSRASLVCNPLYSSNVTYSLTLTCFIFFPCSAIMTFCNLRLWIAAKRQSLKLRRHSWGGGYRPKVALRVLVPVMTVYYTCWTPCVVIMLYNAISGSGVPEWIEFIAVWLPTSNGFLNCIFYFWINHSFRRKFHLVLQKLCLGHCPGSDSDSSCINSVESSVVPGWNSNNLLHERFSSVSSNCTLLTLMPPQTNIREPEPA
ncbi:LOW QUALITY PROTEIN: adenosine receptor A2b [Megalobrama amblycephala]|uniref:LOW QUALITY PROTEIN: adenosine receptor A2b n=1 Tax=Megalobrama amblycephala TaxID=75352 RepID=UPI0020142617|nr:LOW QUALITY PROTEIN: adenosine receptor A2b [Megalobrama amblycephala]